jgi:hypothetical protein
MLDQKIARLEERLKQLKSRHLRVEARRRTLESRRSRREDTRRKILIGAVVLAKVDQGVFQESVLREWLSSALTREDDRELFDLSRLENHSPTARDISEYRRAPRERQREG